MTRTGGGIALIVGGMFCISLNDVAIKLLSGGYPLHQMVFVRSLIAIQFAFVFLHFEGGLTLLRTRSPGLHALRGGLVVFANVAFFAALAAMPLAEATAIFFVAPLLITLFSVVLLKEKIGPTRVVAVGVGFLGVLIMSGVTGSEVPLMVFLLPILAAAAYALMQVLTRRLGVASRASAMSIYIHATFILTSAIFGLIAGGGAFAEISDNESMQFLLRPWAWPTARDAWLFGLIGLNGAIIGYALSQAYRIAPAAVIAPFEYVALPLSILWSWLVWEHVPDIRASLGIALILSAGLVVILREGQLSRPNRHRISAPR